MTDNRSESDERSDLEQAVQSRGDEADAAAGDSDTSPQVPSGIGGESGAGGVVKNQEGNQQ